MRTVSAVLLLLLATPAAAQEVLLRIKPPAGQVSRYQMTMQSDMDIAGGMSVSLQQGIFMTQRVTGVEGDEHTVVVTIDSARVTGPEGMPTQMMADRMRGLTVTMRMNGRGQVLSSTFSDSTVQAALQGMAGQMSPTTPGQVFFPERPVAPGAIWTDSGTTTMDNPQGAMTMTRRLTYKLERLEARGGARHAIISVTGTISQQLGGDAGAGGMTMESDGTVSGQMDFNLDQGRWVANEMRMTMVASTSAMPGPMGISMSVMGTLVGSR